MGLVSEGGAGRELPGGTLKQAGTQGGLRRQPDEMGFACRRVGALVWAVSMAWRNTGRTATRRAHAARWKAVRFTTLCSNDHWSRVEITSRGPSAREPGRPGPGISSRRRCSAHVCGRRKAGKKAVQDEHLNWFDPQPPTVPEVQGMSGEVHEKASDAIQIHAWNKNGESLQSGTGDRRRGACMAAETGQAGKTDLDWLNIWRGPAQKWSHNMFQPAGCRPGAGAGYLMNPGRRGLCPARRARAGATAFRRAAADTEKQRTRTLRSSMRWGLQ